MECVWGEWWQVVMMSNVGRVLFWGRDRSPKKYSESGNERKQKRGWQVRTTKIYWERAAHNMNIVESFEKASENFVRLVAVATGREFSRFSHFLSRAVAEDVRKRAAVAVELEKDEPTSTTRIDVGGNHNKIPTFLAKSRRTRLSFGFGGVKWVLINFGADSRRRSPAVTILYIFNLFQRVIFFSFLIHVVTYAKIYDDEY